MTDPANPLIVQSDLTVLLEVASERSDDARAALARFAELEKAPEHIHTYRITPLSLWNAASSGMEAAGVQATLESFAKYPVPPSVLTEVADQMGRYGRLVIVRDFDSGGLAITSPEPAILEEVVRDRHVAELVGDRLDGNRFAVRLGDRGALKQALLAIGWPAADEAGYIEGETLDLDLTCDLRGYQGESVAAWWMEGSAGAGNGTLVLPCGAGKTVIGLAAMAQSRAHTSSSAAPIARRASSRSLASAGRRASSSALTARRATTTSSLNQPNQRTQADITANSITDTAPLLVLAGFCLRWSFLPLRWY